MQKEQPPAMIGVGKTFSSPPALRTVHAVLPHTALQSVVSSSGLARLHTGFMKGEKPMCREECIWPALMVLMRSTMARAFLTLA